jgi:uncharacterized protein (TIGR00290 family)
MQQGFMNWSGGKDAAFSLYKVLKGKDLDIRYLLTTLSDQYQRVSMHGVREVLLREQARQIGIPLKTLYLPEEADLTAYNRIMRRQLEAFSKEHIVYAVYGDIFLEDLRKYREDRLDMLGMKAVFPLWEMDTRELVHAFLDAGFKAVITCVNARLLDKSFAGKLIDHDFMNALPPGVDPCGENGEFHSFVYDGPIFAQPVKFTTGEVVEKVYGDANGDGGGWDNRFYFCDLLP